MCFISPLCFHALRSRLRGVCRPDAAVALQLVLQAQTEVVLPEEKREAGAHLHPVPKWYGETREGGEPAQLQ